jgi:hypothetical protein
MSNTPKRYPLGPRGLGIVLFILFALSWAGQAIVQTQVLDEGWDQFAASTLENWQSEFLQLLAFVALTSVFIYKGSPESRDSDDELKAKIDRVLTEKNL